MDDEKGVCTAAGGLNQTRDIPPPFIRPCVVEKNSKTLQNGGQAGL